jgi:hypothetical protein
MLDQTHYLVAYDPLTDTENYFKITYDGNTFLSSSKFSIGEYDRESVNRLFSEAGIEFEYLSTKIDKYDQAGARVRDLSSQLSNVSTAQDNEKKKHLSRLSNTLSKELGELNSLISLTPPNKKNDVKPLIEQAEKLLVSGRLAIEKDLGEAGADLHRALGLISTTYSVLAGENRLIHIDPAGNIVDVKNKSLLVFVATDTSRFTDAISNLAESQEATNDLISTLMGPKLNEQNYVSNKKRESDIIYQAIINNLQSQIATLPETDLAKFRESVLKLGKDATNRHGSFGGGDQLRAFSEGLGVRL